MSATTLSTCAGCVLLIIVAAIPVTSRLRVAATAALITGWLLVAVLSVRYLVYRGQYLPATRPSQIVRYGIKELTEARKNRPPNLLIIEGGSYPAAGVNPILLRSELHRLGYRVQILDMALSAGNHFERYTMFSDLVHNPDFPGFPLKTNTVFLAEVQNNYDKSPVAQLEKNLDTARAYQYLTPANAWYALQSLWRGGGAVQRLKDPVWTIIRHVLVNTGNVGLPTRLTSWNSIKPSSGVTPTSAVRGFRFAGLTAVVAAAQSEQTQPFNVPWLFDIRERRLKQLWDGRMKHWVYFGIPSTVDGQMKWLRTFCSATQEACIAADDRTLLHDLDSAPMWGNAGHLSRAGAAVYSRWLARQIVKTGVLRK